MKNILKILFIIIGTLIGAGFASGKEIYIFFFKYGICGIIGVNLSAIILGVLVYKIFNILIKNNNINEYNNLLKYIFKNEKYDISNVINIIINIFLIISFYIMIAGFGAYFKQEYNISIYISSIIIATFCYITLKNKIEGIIKISTILVPIIIIIIFNIGIKDINYSINKICYMNFCNDMIINSILSSILYASYNSIILIPVLVSLKKYINNKNKYIIPIILTFILVFLTLLIYLILLKANVNIMEFDLPLIYIVKQFGNIYEHMYGIVIITSIFTSIISAGYSFLQNCTNSKKGYNILLIFMCISSCFISNIGFSRLVNLLYPVFGVLGLIQIYYILKIKI